MRRTIQTLGWVGLLLWAGCVSPPLEEPRILDFEPDRLVEGSGGVVIVGTEGVPPLLIDYGSSEIEVRENVEFFVGELALQGERSIQHPDQIVMRVPSDLPIGDYPLRLRLADGRETHAAGSFRVSPSPVPVSYTIDPIPDQDRGEPFEITIRALGSAAAGFDGVVSLSSSQGMVFPTVSGPFENGVRIETVTVTPVSDALAITASDETGHSGTSNTFRVRN